jgi:ABC-2 type transport system ATP-binding protein
MGIVETRSLGKDYGSLTAVRDMDLSIEAGEIFGLLGPNGAGKTTTIAMICGVLTPTRGTASVDGYDIRTAPYEAKRRIGLAPQELAIYEEITARQNLVYFGSLYGLRGNALRDALEWALDVVGLAGRDSEPVQRFSGGMKRRLNLAIGLLHRPRVLICDEPTVGVDPQSRTRIFETLRDLNSTHGMSIVYTSHYMEEVQALCSRIGIIDHGRLVALDTLPNLLRAHGQAGAELEVDGDADKVVAALGHLVAAELEGRSIRFPTPESFAAVARAVEETGARIVSLRVAASNLETVFLNLTGRTLRDPS